MHVHAGFQATCCCTGRLATDCFSCMLSMHQLLLHLASMIVAAAVLTVGLAMHALP